MLAPLTNILPQTLIRRERILPAPGKILVRKGQLVNASDVIGESSGKPVFSLIQVARILKIPANQVEKYLQCWIGTELVPGDVIAGPVGITRRMIRATHRGNVVYSSNGQVIIALENPSLQVKAGMAGEVTGFIADYGVVIETTGALVQGVWGNDQVAQSKLHVLANSPEHELVGGELKDELSGKILLAGHCEQAQALERAAQLPIHGLILASLSVSLAVRAAQLPFPLLLLEGFGKFPMNPSAYEILAAFDHQDICLNAEMPKEHSAQRPEVTIPLPAIQGLCEAPRSGFLAPNKIVRVLCGRHARKTGILQQVIGVHSMANGVRARSTEILLDSGEKVILPLANLELLALSQ